MQESAEYHMVSYLHFFQGDIYFYWFEKKTKISSKLATLFAKSTKSSNLQCTITSSGSCFTNSLAAYCQSVVLLKEKEKEQTD